MKKGEMVRNRRAINIKEANNQAKICVGKSVTLHMVLCSQMLWFRYFYCILVLGGPLVY